MIETLQSLPHIVASAQGLAAGAAYPLYFVAADLAEAAGRPLLAATFAGQRLAALASLGPSGRTLLIANFSPAPVALTFADFDRRSGDGSTPKTRCGLRSIPKVFARLGEHRHQLRLASRS